MLPYCVTCIFLRECTPAPHHTLAYFTEVLYSTVPIKVHPCITHCHTLLKCCTVLWPAQCNEKSQSYFIASRYVQFIDYVCFVFSLLIFHVYLSKQRTFQWIKSLYVSFHLETFHWELTLSTKLCYVGCFSFSRKIIFTYKMNQLEKVGSI